MLIKEFLIDRTIYKTFSVQERKEKTMKKILKIVWISLMTILPFVGCSSESINGTTADQQSSDLNNGIKQTIGIHYNDNGKTSFAKNQHRNIVNDYFKEISARRTNSYPETKTAVIEVVLEAKTGIPTGITDETFYTVDVDSDFPTKYSVQFSDNQGHSFLPSGTSLTAGHWVIVTITVTGIEKSPFDVWFNVGAVDPAMILEYDLTLTSNKTIGLHLRGTLVDVWVNWGDGTAAQHITTAGHHEHTYTTEKKYTVKIEGELNGFGHSSAPATNIKALTAVRSFGALELKSLSHAFSGAVNLTIVPLKFPSTVTNTVSMFRNARAFNQNINSWDVTNIRTIYAMFRKASAFNQPLDCWNISNATNMTSMFRDAKAFNQDISEWNVSHVNNMFAMFRGATNFNQSLHTWNVENVKSMGYMFYQASSFNQDLSEWNVSNVTGYNEFDTGTDAWIKPKPIFP